MKQARSTAYDPNWFFMESPENYSSFSNLLNFLTTKTEGEFKDVHDGVLFELESDALLFRLTFGL